MILSSFKLAERYVSGRGARLAAFAKAVCVYFLLAGGAGAGGGVAPGAAAAAAAKCAPVLCLMLTVLAHRADTPASFKERRRYALLVSCGLGLSAAGDALLVWPQHFEAGMGAFGAAHAAYIAAFGWRSRRRRPLTAAALYLATAGFVSLLRLAGALRVLVPLYAGLLATMAWRALALRPSGSSAAPPTTAAAAAAGAGALLFLASDAALAYNMFRHPLPYPQVVVMTTYYLGQLGIALSALQPAPAPSPTPAPARHPHPLPAH